MIRDPEDVLNDGRDAMKEIKGHRDWGVDALPRLMETLNEQTYLLDMRISEGNKREEVKSLLIATRTTIGLMLEICE